MSIAREVVCSCFILNNCIGLVSFNLTSVFVERENFGGPMLTVNPVSCHSLFRLPVVAVVQYHQTLGDGESQ